MHNERLTLATLCGGAVQEKVDRALERVAKNILDPNTDSKRKRTITLTISLKPDEDDKENVGVTANVSVTLAPELGVSTQFYVSKDLEKDTVSIMEHKKGEIKGQLDFSDIDMDAILKEEKAKEEEQPEAQAVGGVVDFRVSR